jgi:hypothetical protein
MVIGQQTTRVFVAKTAIVEKPASKDGARFHSGLCQPIHPGRPTTQERRTIVNPLGIPLLNVANKST